MISSIQEDPIKPVTPVTFPESGTESEVSLARNTFIAFILLKNLSHLSFILKMWGVDMYSFSRLNFGDNLPGVMINHFWDHISI